MCPVYVWERVADMDDGIGLSAQALVAAHGAGAVQHLIDRIVIAVRAQDEVAIAQLNTQLQDVNALLQQQANRRKYGGDGPAA